MPTLGRLDDVTVANGPDFLMRSKCTYARLVGFPPLVACFETDASKRSGRSHDVLQSLSFQEGPTQQKVMLADVAAFIRVVQVHDDRV